MSLWREDFYSYYALSRPLVDDHLCCCCLCSWVVGRTDSFRSSPDSLVRSISTSIQLLSMEAVFSMSKWSEEKVSRRPPCPRNCVSMVGCVVVVVVVYLLLGQGRE